MFATLLHGYKLSGMCILFLIVPFFFFGLRLDIESLKYMYAMVFAVEEINRGNTLLPGVRLGYRIRDSCSRYPWALDAALSLVTGDSNSCDVTAGSTRSAGGKTGEATGQSRLKF